MATKTTQEELIKLSDSYAYYCEYIEGEDSVNGQTLGIIRDLWDLEPSEFADVDILNLIEQVLENYHQYNKQEREDTGKLYATAYGLVSAEELNKIEREANY